MSTELGEISIPTKRPLFVTSFQGTDNMGRAIQLTQHNVDRAGDHNPNFDIVKLDKNGVIELMAILHSWLYHKNKEG